MTAPGSDAERLTALMRRRPAASVIGLILVFLAILVAAEVVAPEAAAVALVIFAFSLLVLVLERTDARDLTRRLSKVSVGKTSLEFAAALSDAAAGARDTVDQQEGDGDAEQDDADQDEAQASAEYLVDLRLSLDRKLTYLAKHILAQRVNGREEPTFLTVGSLATDKYLTRAQARALTWMLTVSSSDVSRPEGAKFLADASRVVRNLRASVFQKLVGRVVKDCGWQQVDVTSTPGRRELIVEKNQTQLRLIPVWAVGGNRRSVESARDRLRSAGDLAVIVVPDQSTEEFPDRPRVLRLGGLSAMLAGH